MPQFRQDFITKEWVIVAPERAKRPDQFRKPKEKKEKPEHDPNCPFCKGNEDKTPNAVYTQGGEKNWTVRVVPNKFAAVDPNILPNRNQDGNFLSADGFGVAEVVIESPSHNKSLALLTKDEVKNVLFAYIARFSALSENEHVDLINLFRNHGAAAGTSLEHPHSQIIATPIVPPNIRHIMHQASTYHDTYGQCPYCVLFNEEMAQGARVVIDAKSYLVFCPYASKTPFQMQIIPKRHYSRFCDITDTEVDELAETLRVTLKKLHVGLDDPDYNFVLRTSPTSDGELHYDHCRLVITPRITTPAGFEIGSGIFINSMPPEDAAAFLREVKAD